MASTCQTIDGVWTCWDCRTTPDGKSDCTYQGGDTFQRVWCPATSEWSDDDGVCPAAPQDVSVTQGAVTVGGDAPDENPYALEPAPQETVTVAEQTETPETFDEPTGLVTETGDPLVVVTTSAPIEPSASAALALDSWDDAESYESEGATVAPGATALPTGGAPAPESGGGALFWAAVLFAAWVVIR